MAFFDLGGTLFSYGDLSNAFNDLLTDQLAAQGIEEESGSARTKYRGAMQQAFQKFGQRPYYLHSELFIEGYHRFLSEYDIESTRTQGLEFYREQMELGINHVRPRSEAVEAIQTLYDANLRMGIVSNIDNDQFHSLWSQINLSRWISTVTTSEEAQSCKPDPEIFKLAMRKFGNPKPSQCMFIGDSPEHDIRGANRMGLHSVWITSRSERVLNLPSGDRPDSVIRRLTELIEIAVKL